MTETTPNHQNPETQYPQRTKEIDELVTILSRRLSRQLENQGMANMRVQALAGKDWAVGRSKNNASNNPDVVVYPKEYVLKGDKNVVNARLRHEIGNLNYPFEEQLTALHHWAEKNNIPPQLLTSLARVIHSPSVDFFELRNSHGESYIQNLKALYKTEIDLEKIVDAISYKSSYTQALDLVYLEGLSLIGVCSSELVSLARSRVALDVDKLFSMQMILKLQNAIQMVDPDKKANFIKDQIFPALASLIDLSEYITGEEENATEDETQDESIEQNDTEDDEPQDPVEEGVSDSDEDGSGEGESNISDMMVNQDGGGSGMGEGESDSGGSGMGGSGMGNGDFMDSVSDDLLDNSNLQDSLHQDDLEGGKSTQNTAEANNAVADPSKMEQNENLAESKSATPQFEEPYVEGDPNSSDEMRSESNNYGSAQGYDDSDPSPENTRNQDEKIEPQRGAGKGNRRSIAELFSHNEQQLSRELKEINQQVASKFSQEDNWGQYTTHEEEVGDTLEKLQREKELVQIAELRRIQDLQEAEVANRFSELGLSAEVLKLYSEIINEMIPFIDDFCEFIIKKFNLDRDFLEQEHLYSGARLEDDYQTKIIGTKDGRVVIRPDVMARRVVPELPVIYISVGIDNSGSCAGQVIWEEKKVAIACTEIERRLKRVLNLEIVCFGGKETDYTFIKKFDTQLYGEDLANLVLLKADQGTPDEVTLEAMCQSIQDKVDFVRKAYPLILFMTDGVGGNIGRVIKKYRRNIGITGIGLEDAASTIRTNWGILNSIEVPDVRDLTSKLLDHLEKQINELFD